MGQKMKYVILIIFVLGFFFGQPCNAQPVEIPLCDNNSSINKDSRSENRIYNQAGELTHISSVAIPRLMVYKPDRICGTAIIICPGGGYRRLNVENTRFIANRLTRMGIIVFVLVYRLPADIVSPDKSIAALQDVQTAFRIIRDKAAEWGLSPDKIGLWGSSAGGHLAAMAATHHSTSYVAESDTTGLRPDFLVLAWPVISFRPDLVNKGSMENLLGKNPSELQVADYSPDECVNGSTPPAFIVHADDDPTVKSGNSIRFYEALKKAGIPAELHIYEKGGHGFGIAPDVSDSWMSQLEVWLKNRGLINKKFEE
jgi:acetyl esterase/lipase